jgi:hypothetical protein
LSDGFINYGGTTLFDAGLNTRNTNYALNISVTSGTAAVPEPGTIGLIFTALSGTAIFARKRFYSVFAASR